ncbi:MAG: adenosine kinase [Proteobacteria bacterium]|nr:adenosine kinase [Alphaproteobacteria bacterium]NCC02961.1 adenosine kinase [Pseudomonadota bacterium]
MVIRDLAQSKVPAVYDVCAVGNAIVDVIADSDETFLKLHGIAKGCMQLVDEERSAYLYKEIGPAIEMSGGSAANTVAGIAALGGTPTYIGKVRDDQLGAIFRHDMQASGVYFPTKPATQGPSTARSIILVTPDSERSMNTYLGVSVELVSEDISAQQIANAQITYLEGYLFDKPQAQEAFVWASTIAEEAGRLVSLTLSDTFCVDRHRAAFRKLIVEKIDILFANEFELMALYQVSSFDEALALAAKDCKVVAGTRSEKGAMIAYDGHTITIAPDPVEKAVDSTGAGDLFAAGFLYGLTHGLDMVESGRLGAVAASEVISHYGPRPQGNLRELALAKGIKI